MQASLPVGTVVAGYRIVRPLGQGGFGIAYEARHGVLPLRAAIKELFPEDLVLRHGLSVEVKAREFEPLFAKTRGDFIKEASILCNMPQHPNIVRVIHFEEANNTAYNVMEFIEGRTLYQTMKDQGRPFSESEAIPIFMELIGALSYIHAHDVLHRDVSPHNVLIRSTGVPVLIDFGAAKTGWRNDPVRSRLVSANPAYAPLEQLEDGWANGPCTDVFEIAATYLHLRTGRVPVDVLARKLAVQSHNRDPMDALLASSALSERERVALKRALQLDPMRRVASAEDLAEEFGWSQPAASPPRKEAVERPSPATSPARKDTANPVADLRSYLADLKSGAAHFDLNLSGSKAASTFGKSAAFAAFYSELVHLARDHMARKKVLRIEDVRQLVAELVEKEEALVPRAHDIGVRCLRLLQRGDCPFSLSDTEATLRGFEQKVGRLNAEDVAALRAVLTQLSAAAEAHIRTAGTISIYDVVGLFRNLLVAG